MESHKSSPFNVFYSSKPAVLRSILVACVWFIPFHWINVPQFILSLVNRYFGHLQFWSIMNEATINTHIQIQGYLFWSWVNTKEQDCLIVWSVFYFIKTANMFSSMDVPFFILTNNVWEVLLFLILASMGYCQSS